MKFFISVIFILFILIGQLLWFFRTRTLFDLLDREPYTLLELSLVFIGIAGLTFMNGYVMFSKYQ